MSIIDQMAGWIDTRAIAEHIVDELNDYGIVPTLEQCQMIWLDVLENELCQAIRASVKAKIKQGYIFVD